MDIVQLMLDEGKGTLSQIDYNDAVKNAIFRGHNDIVKLCGDGVSSVEEPLDPITDRFEILDL